MSALKTLNLADAPVVTAPDGSFVHILPSLSGGGLAQFVLPPGNVARAIVHQTVDEIWFIRSGIGAMWRSFQKEESIVELRADLALTIPCGCHFQFRAKGEEPLVVLGATMPPWPGEDEAVFVEGPWQPTV